MKMKTKDEPSRVPAGGAGCRRRAERRRPLKGRGRWFSPPNPA